MKHTIALSLILSCCCSLVAQVTLISYGSSWRYYDNGNAPAFQGSLDWNDNAYDASSWGTGNSHLGYGDGDEVTTITSGIFATYVRHTFNVADPGIYSELALNLTYDDGAVIYLNGTEIWRVNMPGGTITYNTFASSVSPENAQASVTRPNTLITGQNVLSVEIHQASSASSDISFDFRLNATIPGQAAVIRGPYLQSGSPNSIRVRWRTDVSTESVVQYGTSPGNLNQTASHLTLKTEHDLLISGLAANTVYYYQVSDASDVLVPGSNDLYFKTHPIAGTNQPFRVWVIGDCGTADGNARAVRDAYYNYVDANHTDMMLFLGDNAYDDGTDAEYQFALFENMYEAKLKNTISWSCLGNHDGHTANSNAQTGPYYDIFTFPKNGECGGVASGTEAYYSFDYGNMHFIVLESYETDRSVGGAMYNWAQSDIQNTTADWIVAFWHHPPYSKGSHNSDTETELVQMRQNFLPMLEANGVDLVLAGHSHSYERSYLLNGHYGLANSFNAASHTIGTTGDGDGRTDGDGAYGKTDTGEDAYLGAVYVVTGSAGQASGGTLNHNAMFYSVSQLGSCVLETDNNAMTVKFVRENGTIEDYFTITKPIGCVIGGSCDDGDDCTTGDVYTAGCVCQGTFQDADNDGICDADDQCPGLDDALIGTACNDGDACTTNDVYNASCACAGVFTDGDNDGYCFGDDPDDNDACVPDSGSPECNPCMVVSTDGFEASFGNWLDGGGDCARVSSFPNTGTYSIQLRDNDGAASGMATQTLNLSGMSEVLVDFSYYAVGFEVGEDFFLEYSTNSGASYTVFETWVRGTDFENSTRYSGLVSITGVAWTTTSRLRIRADASGNDDQVYIDDVVVSRCCEIGALCNDNNACSTGDAINSGCQCVGVFQDTDNDGTCDANDQCLGFDDDLLGSPCDDEDACTTNDIYQYSTCTCAGVFTDSDGDGYCVGSDPDDFDACNPDPGSPACSPCTLLNSESYESNFGIWNTGGNDCHRVTSFSNSGAYSVRLRDDGVENSSMFTNNMNLTGATQVDVSFSYYAVGMDANEDFVLEYSTNGGSSYSIAGEWNSGVEFQNNTRYNVSVSIPSVTWTTQSRFRIRCDASANDDQVFVDDVIIADCSSGGALIQTPQPITNMGNEQRSISEQTDAAFVIMPNPVLGELKIQGLSGSMATVEIFSVTGSQMQVVRTNDDTLDVSQFVPGVYFLKINAGGRIMVKRFVKG